MKMAHGSEATVLREAKTSQLQGEVLLTLLDFDRKRWAD